MKNSKPITKTKKHTKKVASKWIEDYFDCLALSYKPVTEAFINRLAQELIRWAETDEDAVKFEQFYAPKYIQRRTFERWIERFDVLRNASEVARSFISCRRELNTLKRKFDASTNNKVMFKYDEDWKDAAMFDNELKAQANKEANSGTQFIVMEKFGSSDLVPEKPSRTPEEVAGEVTMKNTDQMKLSK